MSDNGLAQLLENATVIHLQPDDVLVFSNAGDIDFTEFPVERLKEALGNRKLVFFPEAVDLNLLRDLEEASGD